MAHRAAALARRALELPRHHPLYSPSSGLPRAALCPGSVLLGATLRVGGVGLDWRSAAAAQGAEGHLYFNPAEDLEEIRSSYLRRRVKRMREFIRESVAEIAGEGASVRSGNHERGGVLFEVRYERALTYTLRGEIDPELRTQVLSTTPHLAGATEFTFGTPDVLVSGTAKRGDRWVLVIDGKLGAAEPRDFFDRVQFAAYGRMALDIHRAGRAFVRSLHVESGEENRAEYGSVEELDRPLLEIPRRVAREPLEFRPSREACLYCPAAPWCAALRDSAIEGLRYATAILEEASVRRMADPEAPMLSLRRRSELGEALDRLQPAVQAHQRLRELAIDIGRSGGRIPTGDGGAWEHDEIAGDRFFTDPFAVIERVKDVVEADDYKDLFRPSVAELEDLVAGRFLERDPQGTTKTKAVEEFQERVSGLVARAPAKDTLRRRRPPALERIGTSGRNAEASPA